MDNWQVQINERLPIYIFTAVISFGAGCFLAVILSGSLTIKQADMAVTSETTEFSYFLFCGVPLACTLAFMALSIKIGRNAGNTENVFRAIYEAASENSSNFVLHQFREIIVAIAEVSVIEALAIKYLYKKKITICLIVPFACFALCTLFSTDRNIFLRFIIFSLCLWVFFKTATSSMSLHATNMQIVKRTLLIFLAAVGCFYLLGKAKSYTSNLERMIGIYGGSGLYNFNLTLDQLENVDLQYGKETFSQLIKTLNVFGINLGDGASNEVLHEMIVFTAPNGYVYASNIYSAMGPYVVDFGYAGVIIFPFIMGLFFEFLFICAMRLGSLYLWGLYSMLIYPVVYFPIAEQFYMRLHLGLAYEIFWFSIIYYFSFGKKRIHFTMG